MPPAKRKPPVKQETATKSSNPTVSYCKNCINRGDEVRDKIFKCNKGVNNPYGNHSIIRCLYYEECPTD